MNENEAASNQPAPAEKPALGLSGRLFCGSIGGLALLAGVALLTMSFSSSSVFSILVGLVLALGGRRGIKNKVAPTSKLNLS